MSDVHSRKMGDRRSPGTLGLGPLKPSPAHPIQSLREGMDLRLRGGIGRPLRGRRWEIGDLV